MVLALVFLSHSYHFAQFVVVSALCVKYAWLRSFIEYREYCISDKVIRILPVCRFNLF